VWAKTALPALINNIFILKMNKLRITSLLFFLSFLLFLSSCDSKRVYEKNKEITDAQWNYLKKIKFDDVVINDVASTYNVYINLRNSVDYRYRNIYFFLDIKFPDNNITRDTVECIIADEKGKWLGKGMGKIKDCRILFLRNVKFPSAGTYIFSFEQGMREDVLEGITDVGIRIEKSN
jgi:gliding motility-associated lipoprotein GldH